MGVDETGTTKLARKVIELTKGADAPLRNFWERSAIGALTIILALGAAWANEIRDNVDRNEAEITNQRIRAAEVSKDIEGLRRELEGAQQRNDKAHDQLQKTQEKILEELRK